MKLIKKPCHVLLFLFFGLAIGHGALISTNGKCNDSIYASTKYGYTRTTVLRDGDFMLQGIFSQTKGIDCLAANLEGTIHVVVMQLAIDVIHSSNLLPGFRLGYQFDNACEDIPKVMERGIEIVSMYRPESVCIADYVNCGSKNRLAPHVKPVAGVIGPGFSYLAIPFASLMGLYDIPHISYQASSRLLSKSNLYKSFFRTIPPDTNQVLVMLDMLQKFNWNYIFAIGSDDDYGKLAISAFKDASESRNICVAFDEYITNSKTRMPAQVREIVTKLREAANASLVLLFTYSSMGTLILNEAEKQGIERVWLTSDAWSASGATLNVSKKYLKGILTVGTEKLVIPGLNEYLVNKIKNEALCNPWLESYLRQRYHCNFMQNSSVDCRDKTVEEISSEMLESNSGGYGNLYDAVHAITHAIIAMLKQKCRYQSPNFNKTLCQPFDSEMLLRHMHGVNFTGIFNRSVGFDKDGDPENPHYIIENIQEVNGKLKYVRVGTWRKDSKRTFLDLNTENISWPRGRIPVPESRCSRDCKPGEYVNAKTECCFTCQKCATLHISTGTNVAACAKCPKGYHTNQGQTKCIQTPYVHLTVDSAGGIMILAMSVLGILISLVLFAIFCTMRNYPIARESESTMLYSSLLLVIFSFGYGFFHLTEPSDNFCSARASYFFLIYAAHPAALFTNTQFVKKTVKNLANKLFDISIGRFQIATMILILIIQMTCVGVWLGIDPGKVKSFEFKGHHEIVQECDVEMKTTHLLCMFVPSILLVLATGISFRERNRDHLFNEPKFLCFTSLAMTVVVVAFIPTFRFVVGIYKAIVMAFTVDVWALTYIGSMIVPKLRAIALQRFREITSAVADSDNQSYSLQDSAAFKIATSRRMASISDESEAATRVSQASPEVLLLKKNEKLKLEG